MLVLNKMAIKYAIEIKMEKKSSLFASTTGHVTYPRSFKKEVRSLVVRSPESSARACSG